MQYPLNDLDDCNYNHYRLQLSIYAFMLEENGYVVRNVGFHHLNNLIKFDYLKDHVYRVFNLFHECL